MNKNSDFEPGRKFTFKELASFLCQDSEDPKCGERMFNLLTNDERNGLLPNVEKIEVVKHEIPPTEFIDLGGGTFRNRDDSDTKYETKPRPPEEWRIEWLFVKKYFARKDFWNADDVKAILNPNQNLNDQKSKRQNDSNTQNIPKAEKPIDQFNEWVFNNLRKNPNFRLSDLTPHQRKHRAKKYGWEEITMVKRFSEALGRARNLEKIKVSKRRGRPKGSKNKPKY